MDRLFKNNELHGTKKIQIRSVLCIRKDLDFLRCRSRLSFSDGLSGQREVDLHPLQAHGFQHHVQGLAHGEGLACALA